MNYEVIFEASYGRVMQPGCNFFNLFYEIFVSSSPEVAAYFQNTEMNQQITVMEKSFYKLFAFYASAKSDDYLIKIAQSHNKQHLNVKPYMYDIWLDSIIEAVKQTDSKCDFQVELAWRLILSPGITYMKFLYDHDAE